MPGPHTNQIDLGDHNEEIERSRKTRFCLEYQAA